MMLNRKPGQSYARLSPLQRSIFEEQKAATSSASYRFSKGPPTGPGGTKFDQGPNREIVDLLLQSDSTQDKDVIVTREINRRERIQNFMYSLNFQFLVMFLVFVDFGMVVVEVLIEILYYKKLCLKKEPSEFSHVSHDHHIFHYLSVILSFLFVIELAFKLYVFRCGIVKKWSELFDAAVVACSLATDLYFIHSLDPIDDLAGFIILLRLLAIGIHIEEISAAIKKKALKVNALKEALQPVQPVISGNDANVIKANPISSRKGSLP